MIDVPLVEEHKNLPDDDKFYILIFNLNTDKLAFNKNYVNNEKKNIYSPDFFRFVEGDVSFYNPNIVVVTTEKELENGTYFHSDFLPNEMFKMKYKILIRDKITGNNKLGTLRMSIYVKINDTYTKNLELNKKIFVNDNTYESDNCVSLVLYTSTKIGVIAFIGACTTTKKISELENKFLNNKECDYTFIVGDFPKINILDNYKKGIISNKIVDADFYRCGDIFHNQKIKYIECINYLKIKDDNVGLKTGSNIGLLGLYSICDKNEKSINIMKNTEFPVYCLSSTGGNNINKIFKIEISHNSVFFLFDNRMYVNIDNIPPNCKDKFFLSRNPSDFNGYWIIEDKKNIDYNNFVKIDLGNEIITSFSSGYEHIIYLNNNGEIFGRGNNKQGQLGIYSPPICHFFRKIDIENVLFVRCGSFHTVVKTTTGLYSFGNNLHGQLGLSGKYLINVNIPTEIQLSLGDIKDCSCGDYHTIILFASGDIYGFGSNKYGQLGMENPDDVSVPKKIKFSNVKKISCGDNHTLIYTNSGLYLFYKIINDLEIKIIHKIDLEDILCISSGKDHSLILTTMGLFGINLPNLNPIAINIEDVKSITCGFRSSIIQTQRNHTHVYMFHDIMDNMIAEYAWDVI